MRQKILKLLQEASDTYLSGEQISKELNISRAAVWKHISALRQHNIQIEAVASKGYRLAAVPKRLCAEALKPHLATRYLGRSVLMLEETASTNLIAKQLAAQDCPMVW